MTLEEVSAMLRISPGTAANRLSEGKPMPPSFKVGRRRLFLVEEVRRWIANASVDSDGATSALHSAATVEDEISPIAPIEEKP
jgi:hypothetical protein